MNHDAGKTPYRCDLHIPKNIFMPYMSSLGTGLHFWPVVEHSPIYVYRPCLLAQLPLSTRKLRLIGPVSDIFFQQLETLWSKPICFLCLRFTRATGNLLIDFRSAPSLSASFSTTKSWFGAGCRSKSTERILISRMTSSTLTNHHPPHLSPVNGTSKKWQVRMISSGNC